MRKYIMIISACWLSVSVKAQGQELTFVSSAVEEGIRQHLNITDDESINFLQLDTITTLDLSRRGISDIHDLVLLPKLRSLDLSDNVVDDLRPLVVLNSLEWVDLSYNNLKGINDLFYSTSKKLTINVAFNYIRDFSIFGSISSCNFTLEGAGLQLNDDAPYFDVCKFVCDATESPAVVYCLVRTNMDEAVRLQCVGEETEVPIDGEYFKHELQYGGEEPLPIVLTNGMVSETAYLVLPKYKWAGDGETVTLTTGLPDGYTLSHAFAGYGTVEVAGNTLQYTAPAEAVEDVVNFCYYEGETLKGFSRFYVNKDRMGDVNRNGVVDIADVVLIINHNLGQQPVGTFVPRVADVDGNSSINVNDAIRIAEYIVGKVKSLSVQATEP